MFAKPTFSRKIASININAISSTLKKNLLRDFVWNNEIDILFLQEVAFENFNFLPSHLAFVNISSDNKGTAILVRKNIDFFDVLMNPNGRITSIRIGGINFINIYAHSGSAFRKERDTLFTQDILAHLSQTYSNVILGDFNCILLKKDSNGVVKNISQGLQQLVDSFLLRDIGNSLNSKTFYTFFRGDSMSRLDRVYGPQTFLEAVRSFETLATPFSDHHSLIVKFETDSNSNVTVCGKGYWKINPTLLSDDDIKNEFVKVIRDTKRRQAYTENFCDWWVNHLKTKAKSFFKTKSFELNKCVSDSKNFLYGCLKEITIQQNEGKNVSREMGFVKTKLMNIEQSRIENLKMKTSACNILEDEKMSLFQISKRVVKSNSPMKLDLNGNLTSDPKKLKIAIEDHFESLYENDKAFYPGASNFLDTIDRRLSPEDCNSLTAPVRLSELEQALQQSTKKKSPGPDGLTYEFYSIFFNDLKDDLLRLFNELLSGTVPHSTFTEGVITLIPKNETSHNLNDKRPISMLNCDYKLFAKILYNRLQPLMEHLIGPGQAACLPEKSCTTNLKILRNITLKSSKSKRFKGTIVSIDLEKAFDRVDHGFLWLTMEKFGFPIQFVNCIRNLYSKASSKVLYNGLLTKNIRMKSSVRQGCPLSMAFFILYIEPLIRKISSSIKGCFIDNSFCKVIAYADDINIFIRDDEEFDKILEIIDNFSLYAKIKLNIKKSSYMRLNNCRTGPHLLKETDTLKILGVEMCRTYGDTVNSNYSNVIKSIKYLIVLHQRRHLNIFQKTWILNYLILSKLWYLSQVYPPNNCHIAQIKTFCRNFIFKGVGIFKVCLNQLYLNVEKGGLALIDAESKMKSLFIKNILQRDQSSRRDDFMIMQEHSSTVTRNTREWIRMGLDIENLGMDLTCKRIYTFLLDKQNIAPNIVKKYPNKSWDICWKNLNSNFISSEEKHFLFLFLNETIATKCKLFDKKISGTVNNLCEFCGGIDTLEHRIKLCANSKNIWEWIERCIRDKLKISVHNPEELLNREIHEKQYQSKVALWLTTIGISYNLKNFGKHNLDNFIDMIREKRWNNKLWYRKCFQKWINVL